MIATQDVTHLQFYMGDELDSDSCEEIQVWRWFKPRIKTIGPGFVLVDLVDPQLLGIITVEEGVFTAGDHSLLPSEMRQIAALTEDLARAVDEINSKADEIIEAVFNGVKKTNHVRRNETNT